MHRDGEAALEQGLLSSAAQRREACNGVVGEARGMNLGQVGVRRNFDDIIWRDAWYFGSDETIQEELS